MSMNDPIANALSKILNSEKIGQKTCLIKPVSNTLKKILDVMNENNYIGTYAEIEDGRGKHLKLNLTGNINNCNVIKPRFSVKIETYEKFEKRFLPAKDFGIIIMSTSQGVMTHNQAKEKRIGGKLLAYCY